MQAAIEKITELPQKLLTGVSANKSGTAKMT
jgi:hypothetical protein